MAVHVCHHFPGNYRKSIGGASMWSFSIYFPSYSHQKIAARILHQKSHASRTTCIGVSSLQKFPDLRIWCSFIFGFFFILHRYVGQLLADHHHHLNTNVMPGPGVGHIIQLSMQIPMVPSFFCFVGSPSLSASWTSMRRTISGAMSKAWTACWHSLITTSSATMYLGEYSSSVSLNERCPPCSPCLLGSIPGVWTRSACFQLKFSFWREKVSFETRVFGWLGGGGGGNKLTLGRKVCFRRKNKRFGRVVKR